MTRMRSALAALAALLAIVGVAPAQAPPGPADAATPAVEALAPRMAIGSNVGGGNGSYECGNLITSDLMAQASPFFGWAKDKTPPPMRPDGYPAYVDATTGECYSLAATDAQLPPGRYRLLADGRGKVVVSVRGWADPAAWWRELAVAGPDSTLAIDSVATMGPRGQVTVKITASAPADPVRNVRLLISDADPSHPYNPAFLADLRPYRVLRFMDWTSTNNGKLREWADLDDRPFSFAGKGRVPFALAIGACNRLGSDPWVCIPHLASDDFIDKMAAAFDAGLDPGRTIYVELSNELWNWNFGQANDLNKQFLAERPGGSLWAYHGARSARAVNRFAAACGPGRRVVRVVSGQFNWRDAALESLKAARDNGGFDLAACAPYFATALDDATRAKLAAQYNAGDAAAKAAAVDAVIAAMPASRADVAKGLAAWKSACDALGVPLAAYECGQHLAEPSRPERHELLMAVNRDPRMHGEYLAYLRSLEAAGVSLAMHFTSTINPTNYGYWGASEHLLAPWQSSPKRAALMQSIAERSVRAPEAPTPPPAPSVSGVRLIYSDGTTRDLATPAAARGDN